MPRITQPPSIYTGSQAQHQRTVVDALNGIPQFSYFTQTDPNNVLQGFSGDFAISLNSTVTSRVWVNNSAQSTNPSFVSWGLLGVNVVTSTITLTTALNPASPYSVKTTDRLVYLNGSSYGGGVNPTANLPTAASFGAGNAVWIRFVNDGVTRVPIVNANAADTIESAGSYSLGTWNSALGLMSSGVTGWYLLSADTNI